MTTGKTPKSRKKQTHTTTENPHTTYLLQQYKMVVRGLPEWKKHNLIEQESISEKRKVTTFFGLEDPSRVPRGKGRRHCK